LARAGDEKANHLLRAILFRQDNSPLCPDPGIRKIKKKIDKNRPKDLIFKFFPSIGDEILFHPAPVINSIL
jgi:hypothetical protein